MARVLSLVRGKVGPARIESVRSPYERALADGLPPMILTSYLLADADGGLAIGTLWRDRTDLEAMLATGEEPFARRLIREAGGEPSAEVFAA